MKLTTHTELHDKWMRDETYRKQYEAELKKEDNCPPLGSGNEIETSQTDS